MGATPDFFLSKTYTVVGGEFLSRRGRAHVENIRVLLQVVIFTASHVVHLDELPQPIRAVEPALFLQTLEKIESHQMVSTDLQIGLQFGRA